MCDLLWLKEDSGLLSCSSAIMVGRTCPQTVQRMQEKEKHVGGTELPQPIPTFRAYVLLLILCYGALETIIKCDKFTFDFICQRRTAKKQKLWSLLSSLHNRMGFLLQINPRNDSKGHSFKLKYLSLRTIILICPHFSTGCCGKFTSGSLQSDCWKTSPYRGRDIGAGSRCLVPEDLLGLCGHA